MTKYANLIFDNPDKKSVLNHNCYILVLDLATIAQKGWISHAILNGVTGTLQMNTEHTLHSGRAGLKMLRGSAVRTVQQSLLL